MVNHRNINQTREKIVNLKAAACHREVHVLCAVAGVGSLVNQLTSQKVVLNCTGISIRFSDKLIRSFSSIRHSCFLLRVPSGLLAFTLQLYFPVADYF